MDITACAKDGQQGHLMNDDEGYQCNGERSTWVMLLVKEKYTEKGVNCTGVRCEGEAKGNGRKITEDGGGKLMRQ